jgi:hypothetical protein
VRESATVGNVSVPFPTVADSRTLIWFITGVNSGFGRLMTEQPLARGDRVAGTVRKLDAVSDLEARDGDLLRLALAGRPRGRNASVRTLITVPASLRTR